MARSSLAGGGGPDSSTASHARAAVRKVEAALRVCISKRIHSYLNHVQDIMSTYT